MEALLLASLLAPGQGLHCYACHSSQDSLKKYETPEPEGPALEEVKVQSCGGPPPKIPKHVKFRVSQDFLSGPGSVLAGTPGVHREMARRIAEALSGG